MTFFASTRLTVKFEGFLTRYVFYAVDEVRCIIPTTYYYMERSVDETPERGAGVDDEPRVLLQ